MRYALPSQVDEMLGRNAPSGYIVRADEEGVYIWNDSIDEDVRNLCGQEGLETRCALLAGSYQECVHTSRQEMLDLLALLSWFFFGRGQDKLIGLRTQPGADSLGQFCKKVCTRSGTINPTV